MLRTTLAILLVTSTSAFRSVRPTQQTSAQTGASAATEKEMPEYYKGDPCSEKCWPELDGMGQTRLMGHCKLCHCYKEDNKGNPSCKYWNKKMQDPDFAAHFNWTV